MSLKNHKFQPHGGATGKVRGSQTSVGFILWGTWVSVQNFISIHPIIVEIFQPGPKWCTEPSGQHWTLNQLLHLNKVWTNWTVCWASDRRHRWENSQDVRMDKWRSGLYCRSGLKKSFCGCFDSFWYFCFTVTQYHREEQLLSSIKEWSNTVKGAILQQTMTHIWFWILVHLCS